MVTFAPTEVSGAKLTLSLERRISNRVSLSELSRQLKLICEEETGEALRLLGAVIVAFVAAVLENAEAPALFVARTL